MSVPITTVCSSHIYESTVEAIGNDELDPETGAETIAATTAALEHLESGLSTLWVDIIDMATNIETAGVNMVELLINLARRQDLKDSAGNTVKIHGATVWKDLPMFGWEVNASWNSLDVPVDGPGRCEEIKRFVNVNRFLAMLVHHPDPVFTPYRMQILWTFREGLETPSVTDEQKRQLQIWIPGIAAVVNVLGSEIGSWQHEYGVPGTGKELWNGRPGFSKERWAFWRTRLEEIAGQEDVDVKVRRLADEAAKKMV